MAEGLQSAAPTILYFCLSKIVFNYHLVLFFIVEIFPLYFVFYFYFVLCSIILMLIYIN